MNDYELLGVNKNSDIKEIKKQYINLIKKNHPDKGGNNEDFIKINNAYNNIINKKTNKYESIIKDLYENGVFNKYINLLYNNFIYNHFHDNKVIKINYTLEELYNGCIKTINYKRKIAISPTEFINENKTINLTIDHNSYNNKKIIYNNYGNGYIYGKI